MGAGRHIDETEILQQDKNLEVDVPEGHDRMIHGGVSDPKIRTERNNQLLDEEGLFARATEDLTAQHRPGEETVAGRETSVGGRIRTTTPRHETPTMRK